MLWLILLYVLLGLLMMGISLPMITKSIKPNPWYGFRTPKTLSDPAIWYPANAHSGVLLLIAGAINTVAALALALIPGLGKDGYAFANVAITLSTLAWVVIRSFQYLKRL